IFEFYVVPKYRCRMFDLFAVLFNGSDTSLITTQSNDPLLTPLLHAFAETVTCESILFHDRITTAHAPKDVVFRRTTRGDKEQMESRKLDSEAAWLLEKNAGILACGGILFHYNRPYGDIYMQVAEDFRKRGLGSYLVQELKRVCYEGGNIPAARCNPKNLASRRTLQNAGFVPCGHILHGTISR